MRNHVDRYAEALLRKQRPKSFARTQDEVEMLAAVIDLTAGASSDVEPRPAFVEQLRRRIEQQESEETAAPRPAWRAPARRRSLAAGALTVSGAAVGVAGAQLFSSGAAVGSTAELAELTPVNGSWQAVADGAALPEGAVLPFDLGPITGFLRRSGGRVQAVSGICTHQGCRLELTDSRTEIGCPCHGATFNLAGTNLTHPRVMGHPLPALPRLPVRELDGQIEIYAPMPQMPQTHAASPAVDPSPGATSPDGGTGA